MQVPRRVVAGHRKGYLSDDRFEILAGDLVKVRLGESLVGIDCLLLGHL